MCTVGSPTTMIFVLSRQPITLNWCYWTIIVKRWAGIVLQLLKQYNLWEKHHQVTRVRLHQIFVLYLHNGRGLSHKLNILDRDFFEHVLVRYLLQTGPCSSLNKIPFLNHILVILLFRWDVKWDTWLCAEYKVTYLSRCNL